MRRVYDESIRPLISWQTASAIIGIALIVFIYLYNIGTLLPGMSPSEIQYISSSSTKNELIANPLYAPHKIVVYGLTKLKVYSPEALRSISALFVSIVIVGFYNVLKKWHSRRIALITTVMFASSSWLLAVARHSTPYALLLMWFLLIAALLWFRHHAKKRFWVFVLALLFIAAAYVPTAPYIFAVFGLLYGKKNNQVIGQT